MHGKCEIKQKWQDYTKAPLAQIYSLTQFWHRGAPEECSVSGAEKEEGRWRQGFQGGLKRKELSPRIFCKLSKSLSLFLTLCQLATSAQVDTSAALTERERERHISGRRSQNANAPETERSYGEDF